MSSPNSVRRTDRLLNDEGVEALLQSGYCGHLGTVGADGVPYVCPLLYVWIDREIWVHNTAASGHLKGNVQHSAKVCFAIDKPGEVFPYGRFECDTSVAYASVIAFGQIRIIDDREQKGAFFDALMRKYATPDPSRPKGFYPRLDDVTVYAITPERITGKENHLPAPQARWPAVDMTRTPRAVPPASP